MSTPYTNRSNVLRIPCSFGGISCPTTQPTLLSIDGTFMELEYTFGNIQEWIGATVSIFGNSDNGKIDTAVPVVPNIVSSTSGEFECTASSPTISLINTVIKFTLPNGCQACILSSTK